ncbi:hypothetical protein IV102_22785 [bacterium]|nr:hypothetical protein [bacterium]
MNINTRFTGVTAPALTKGIQGKNIAPLSEHLASNSADTVEVLGSGLKSQIMQDLKALHQAVDSGGAQSISFHTASMAAGALLGVSGLVLHDMAGKLHQAVKNPEKLEELAGQVRDLPQQRTKEQPLAGDVFTSLSNRTLGSAVEHGVKGQDVPVAMFLGGGFLSNEQQQGTLLDYQFADDTRRRSG